MKPKKIAAVILSLLLVAAFLYTGLVKHTVSKEIRVRQPPFRLAEQISVPANVVKWMMPFSADGAVPDIQIRETGKVIRLQKDSVVFTIESIFNTHVKLFSGGDQHSFKFRVSPDTAGGAQSTVMMTYKTSWLQEWLGGNKAIKNAVTSFENLKEYLLDTKKFYGYEIRMVTVVDTSFLFLRETVPLTEKRNATKRMFEQLISHAEKKDAGYNGIRILYPLQNDDSIILFASIGVSKRVNTPENDPIQYKLMPFEKKLLEATYQGSYGESSKVFRALEQYKYDFGLTSMAIPFQKFLSDGYDFAEDQVVQMKVYYPIF
jgi:effector-binding domain-containing protein